MVTTFVPLGVDMIKEKKDLILFFICIVIFGIVFSKCSDATEYETAVASNVIQNGANAEELMKIELERMMHKNAIQMITIMQAYLPAILDGVATKMRLEADKKYKCSLLEDTKIKDDC